MMVKVEVEVSKDLSEVGTLLVGLIADLKAKKELSLVLAENLPALMTAIEGFDQALVEAKDAKATVKYVGVLAGQLAEVLM
jgi:hypothetical protein